MQRSGVPRRPRKTKIYTANRDPRTRVWCTVGVQFTELKNAAVCGARPGDTARRPLPNRQSQGPTASDMGNDENLRDGRRSREPCPSISPEPAAHAGGRAVRMRTGMCWMTRVLVGLLCVLRLFFYDGVLPDSQKGHGAGGSEHAACAAGCGAPRGSVAVPLGFD